MTLDSTLDLLYFVSSIAVLWVAAMLTWLLFEAALAMRNANRMIRRVQDKVQWLEKTITGIGERLESSASYVSLLAKGGKAIASYIKERRDDRDRDDDEDEDRPKKKKAKRRR